MIRIAAGYLNLKFSSYWGSDDLQELAGTVAQCLLPARSEISRRDRLRGWGGRIRTLMCKVKIHLFELSAMFGFICTSADRLSFQENNFLFRGCPRAPLPTHAVRRAGLNTSEFESSEGGLSNSNCGENFGSIDVWQATVRAKIAASERCARSLK